MSEYSEETIRIVSDRPKGYRTIAKRKFDPETMKEYTGPTTIEKAASKADVPAPAASQPSGAAKKGFPAGGAPSA